MLIDSLHRETLARQQQLLDEAARARLAGRLPTYPIVISVLLLVAGAAFAVLESAPRVN